MPRVLSEIQQKQAEDRLRYLRAQYQQAKAAEDEETTKLIEARGRSLKRALGLADTDEIALQKMAEETLV